LNNLHQNTNKATVTITVFLTYNCSRARLISPVANYCIISNDNNPTVAPPAESVTPKFIYKQSWSLLTAIIVCFQIYIYRSNECIYRKRQVHWGRCTYKCSKVGAL